jgi:hypothetical protein
MHMKKRAALMLVAAVSACAAPSADKPDGHLDGTYIGHRTLDPSCGTKSEDFTFYVEGNEISNRSHSGRHRLVGTVGIEGQIALHDLSDRRHIEGSITGTQLVATELAGHSTSKNRKALAVYDPLGDTCLWRFEATRVPNDER